MAIPQSSILAFEGTTQARKSEQTIKEAKLAGKQTAFLCHSHLDANLAKNVQSFLRANKWEVYIDWDDATMPDRPSRETAARIQHAIGSLHWFLFLATQNSMKSRWCPWEIGYADGIKPHDNIIVLPTTDYFTAYGNEYLGLYRRIDIADQGGYGVFPPDGRFGSVLGSLTI
jgi:hypothetical protein